VLSLGGVFSDQGLLATGVNGAAGTATIDISQGTPLKGGGHLVFGAEFHCHAGEPWRAPVGEPAFRRASSAA
jgi:hypothetical protein